MADERTRQTETSLAAILEQMPCGLFRMNRAGLCRYVNRRWCEIAGMSSEEAMGEGWARALRPEDRAEIVAAWQTAVRDGAPSAGEYRFGLGEGAPRWVAAEVVPEHNADGKVIGYVGAIIDITARKQVEDAFARSEAFLNATGRVAKVGGWELEAATRAVRWTPETYRIHDLSVGTDPPLEKAIDFYHPEDRPQLKRALERALNDGEPYDMELRLITATGKHLWVRTICEPQLVDGKTVRLFGTLQDITERKQAEAERERLMTAIEQSAEAVVITDAEGTIQYVNPAFEKISGYGRDEILGGNPRLLKSGKHDDAFYEDLWDTLLRGETWSGRMVNQRQDGSLYTQEMTISPVRDISGKTTNYVAVQRDVSDWVALEAQLRQAQKMEAIGQLAGGVAHDFNNVLQAILGYQELAARGLPEGHAARADLEQIRKTANKAVTLTRQLLAFSRRQILQPQDLDLNELIRGQIEVIGRVIGETVELVFVPGEELRGIRADPVLFEQVLINLCINARDAMASGGRLVIETCNETLEDGLAGDHATLPPGEYIRLTLTDEGCGMSEEIVQRIFEPFFSTKDPGKGTGLGLATVLGIVEQHDGAIEVTSELGAGTSFHIHLPAVDRPAEPAPGRISGSLARGSETILVAEDNSAVRDSAVRVLEEAGYTVLVASDGEEALAVLGAHTGKVSLALLDVVMPKLAGPEVSDRIRETDPDLRVVFLSGYSPAGIHTQFVLDEGVHLLRKPCEPRVLLEKIREVLDTR